MYSRGQTVVVFVQHLHSIISVYLFVLILLPATKILHTLIYKQLPVLLTCQVNTILHLLSYLLNDWMFVMLRISYIWTEVFQSFSIPSFSPLIGLYFNSSKIKVEFYLPTAGYDCVLLHLASHLSWNCILTLQSAKIFIMFAQGFN